MMQKLAAGKGKKAVKEVLQAKVELKASQLLPQDLLPLLRQNQHQSRRRSSIKIQERR